MKRTLDDSLPWEGPEIEEHIEVKMIKYLEIMPDARKQRSLKKQTR